jgi:polyhydroxyalkanoate synthesis repressor PhaR
MGAAALGQADPESWPRDWPPPAGSLGKENNIMMSEDLNQEPAEVRRVIKRYSNRKLYDTKDSRYVTLLQIAELVRAGEDVQIIDNSTKEDKTDITLALIISEELKAKPRGIPLATLKALIRQRGEKILTQLREGPIGRLMTKEEEAAQAAASLQNATFEQTSEETAFVTDGEDDGQKGLKGVRATLENWQAAIDERIRTVIPDFSILQKLEQRITAIDERLDALEKKLDSGKDA